ncbi:hypothetical protein BZJ19_14595 [Salinivibrio proteolyticus]|uniref:hypothetical protein n=1 Tax=Salinivibrio proteolyticus TaxID=334715 RepID=UPI0009899CAC|nr:hypothetical protein [Salinivibrio proteolyticus]OOF22460.1 hypothetical protein BZJ19_14595 [Salinivibrio proteolyticus]
MKFSISILAICLLLSVFNHPNSLEDLEFEIALYGFLLSFALDYLVKYCSISTLGKLDNRNVHIKYNLLWIFVSHGYFLSQVFKDSIRYRSRVFRVKQEKIARAKFIQKANLYNLWTSSVILVAIASLSMTEVFRDYESFKVVITWFVIFRTLSRSIEIVYAFSKDVIKGEEKTSSALTKYNRIQLALSSYIENIVNYGVVYYFFNMTSISNAVLVSISRSTISNVDPSTCLLDQALAYGQVLTTLSLVVLSLAIYVSRKK